MCVYVEWFEVGYCQQNPIPEPPETFPPEPQQEVDHLGYEAQDLSAWATTIVSRLPSCAGTVDATSSPGLDTGEIPDPLNVVPDQVLQPSGTPPVDLLYCLGY